MSPRTGRPPVENPKLDRITVRLNEYEQGILEECTEHFKISNAEVMRRGLSLMEVAKDNEMARQLLDAIILLNEFILKKNADLIPKQIAQVQSNFVWYMESLQRK